MGHQALRLPSRGRKPNRELSAEGRELAQGKHKAMLRTTRRSASDEIDDGRGSGFLSAVSRRTPSLGPAGDAPGGGLGYDN